METKPQIFYKVVARAYNRLPKYISAIVEQDNPYCIEYQLNEWTYPKRGKIFVFESFANAWTFVLAASPNKHELFVLKCEANNPVKAPCCAFFATEEYIEDFWRRMRWQVDETKRLVNAHIFSNNAPKGTYFADAVKLIGEPIIKEEDKI